MDDLLHEMISPAPTPGDKPRRRRLWASGAIIALALVGATSLTTSAVFRDHDQSAADIRTGTIDLTADEGGGASELQFSVPVANMLPGASIVAPVTVRNSGSLRFRYAIGYTATNATDNPVASDLIGALRLTLFTSDTCTLATADDFAGQSGTGFGLADEALLAGNVADPEDAGQDLYLSAGQSLAYCARIDFDRDAGDELQDTGATVTLTFDAVQLEFDAGDASKSGVTGPSH